MEIFRNRCTEQYRAKENDAVKAELEAAGIPILTLPGHLDTEVKTSYVGVLNGFVFIRAWRYWVCEGDMPLDNAQEIYCLYQPLMIRAAGHAGNPEPSEVSYCPAQQKREQETFELMRAKGATTMEIREALERLTIDTGGPRFVRQYHIDTAEGLTALAQYIKEKNIYAHNGENGSYAQHMAVSFAVEGENS